MTNLDGRESIRRNDLSNKLGAIPDMHAIGTRSRNYSSNETSIDCDKVWISRQAAGNLTPPTHVSFSKLRPVKLLPNGSPQLLSKGDISHLDDVISLKLVWLSPETSLSSKTNRSRTHGLLLGGGHNSKETQGTVNGIGSKTSSEFNLYQGKLLGTKRSFLAGKKDQQTIIFCFTRMFCVGTDEPRLWILWMEVKK